jgi:hypothetical protein
MTVRIAVPTCVPIAPPYELSPQYATKRCLPPCKNASAVFYTCARAVCRSLFPASKRRELAGYVPLVVTGGEG